MRSLLVTLATVSALAGPLAGAAEDLYSFVDGDGVIHVTNVPQDPRYRRVRARVATQEGVYRIVVQGHGSRSSPARPADLALRSAPYDEHIRLAAEKYRLPTPLLKAVMAVESNFDPRAVSEKGAAGLMQLMPGTARDLEVSDAHDPAQSIDGGARYLSQLRDLFGNDLEKMLAAYNAGPEAVRRSGGLVPAIPETQAYVRRVLSLYQAYIAGG